MYVTCIHMSHVYQNYNAVLCDHARISSISIIYHDIIHTHTRIYVYVYKYNINIDVNLLLYTLIDHLIIVYPLVI